MYVVPMLVPGIEKLEFDGHMIFECQVEFSLGESTLEVWKYFPHRFTNHRLRVLPEPSKNIGCGLIHRHIFRASIELDDSVFNAVKHGHEVVFPKRCFHNQHHSRIVFVA